MNLIFKFLKYSSIKNGLILFEQVDNKEWKKMPTQENWEELCPINWSICQYQPRDNFIHVLNGHIWILISFFFVYFLLSNIYYIMVIYTKTKIIRF